MEKFNVWFANSKIASFLRTFFAVVLTNAVLEIQRTGKFDFTNWQAWFVAAVISVAPTFLRYLNPQDSLS